MNKLILSAAALLALAVPSAADAACRPAQINGQWSGYGSNAPAWANCELTITGARNATGRCRGTLIPFSPVRWQIRVAPSCQITGHTGGAKIIGAMASDGQTFTTILVSEDFGSRPVDNDGFLIVFMRR